MNVVSKRKCQRKCTSSACLAARASDRHATDRQGSVKIDATLTGRVSSPVTLATSRCQDALESLVPGAVTAEFMTLLTRTYVLPKQLILAYWVREHAVG